MLHKKLYAARGVIDVFLENQLLVLGTPVYMRIMFKSNLLAVCGLEIFSRITAQPINEIHFLHFLKIFFVIISLITQWKCK